jgi:hypothetical protein
VAETTTFVVEILVGLACLGAAAGARRRSMWLAGLLLVAGLAAVIHGIAALAS